MITDPLIALGLDDSAAFPDDRSRNTSPVLQALIGCVNNRFGVGLGQITAQDAHFGAIIQAKRLQQLQSLLTPEFRFELVQIVASRLF
jgi:hypothetical protein